MSRRVRVEQTAGDDSFLDIVANVVGILIILIVVAGVRARQTPIELPPSPMTTAVTPALPLPVSPPEPRPEPEPEPEPPPTNVIAPSRPRPPTVLLPAIVDRSDEVTEIADELVRLEEQLLRRETALAASRRRLETARSETRRRRTFLESRQQDVQVLLDKQALADGTVQTLTRQHQQALLTLEEITRRADPVKPLTHRLTPVSKTVRGKEQHFHVAGGRVASIPLKRLQQRVRDQLTKHARFASRFQKHEGRVGPVDGFLLDYTIQRRPLSVVDELKYGRGMVRIGVTHWTIQPEEDVVSETPEQALARGSRFHAALKSCHSDTALTFWVYPDSFAAFRRLQSAAQRAGFHVAGRPLPEGVQVSGSPDGSRSLAQ